MKNIIAVLAIMVLISCNHKTKKSDGNDTNKIADANDANSLADTNDANDANNLKINVLANATNSNATSNSASSGALNTQLVNEILLAKPCMAMADLYIDVKNILQSQPAPSPVGNGTTTYKVSVNDGVTYQLEFDSNELLVGVWGITSTNELITGGFGATCKGHMQPQGLLYLTLLNVPDTKLATDIFATQPCSTVADLPADLAVAFSSYPTPLANIGPPYPNTIDYAVANASGYTYLFKFSQTGILLELDVDLNGGTLTTIYAVQCSGQLNPIYFSSGVDIVTPGITVGTSQLQKLAVCLNQAEVQANTVSQANIKAYVAAFNEGQIGCYTQVGK